MSPSAVITGGAQGIGRAIVERFVADGYRVGVVDQNAEALAALAGPGIEVFPGDVRDDALIDRACTQVRGTDPLTTFVANAGVIRPAASTEQDLAEWELTVSVNLTGVFTGTRTARGHMAAGSSVVLLSSISAVRGFAERAAYCATKSGVNGLVRSLATEWGPAGIRVNAIAPGSTRTEMMQSMIDAGRATEDTYTSHSPLGRLAEPSEMASVVSFLAGPDASFVSGVVIQVDGGWHAAGLAAHA
ncbi:SDR family NAD(P)-dependent oxidoreductase [Granulicoccus phenolivorans]|uniref:SDR family NAD(P)-dependent oxidoreductase n=1 Tax=Granulicoccus phenolivorans TaxID=266854 RepID=UPI0003FBB6DA|nr:SDR family oxidoreductase [Granulicoccus phenolivorans]